VSKQFYEKWTEKEIFDHVDEKDVLVLFVLPKPPIKEVGLSIYGKLDDEQKESLLLSITEEFGGESLSDDICYWINEFARLWYEKTFGVKRIRLINFGKKEG